MKRATFTIHPMDNPDPDDAWVGYAIMPSDADAVNRGYVIGDVAQVKQLAARLNAFLKTRKHDGEISHLDERLGWKWLDIADALQIVNAENARLTQDGLFPERALHIAPSTIRKACADGRIPYAKLDGKTWIFPQATFLGWLKRQPHTRGRPPKQKQSH